MNPNAKGPLLGLRIVEFAGLGPGPFAAMMLSDMGADVVRVERPGRGRYRKADITARGRRVVELDLKAAPDLETARELVNAADVLIEGFRPGVMERLGLGPEDPFLRNQKLIYARMTGWGQYGPLSRTAGHDINYIAITGALAAIGPRDGVPVPPLNLVGDYGGGALYLVVGILAACMEAAKSGRGQVIDCAMCDGVINMMSLFHEFAANGQWNDEHRGTNLLDGGAPYYRTYECADGKHVAVGALEPEFYALLCGKAGLPEPLFRHQNNPADWSEQTLHAAEIFRSKTQAQWCAILEGTDACFAPVLTMSEAAHHPHIAKRSSFVEVGGVRQAAPSPRFSRTPSAVQSPPPEQPCEVKHVLAQWSGSVV